MFTKYENNVHLVQTSTMIKKKQLWKFDWRMILKMTKINRLYSIDNHIGGRLCMFLSMVTHLSIWSEIATYFHQQIFLDSCWWQKQQSRLDGKRWHRRHQRCNQRRKLPSIVRTEISYFRTCCLYLMSFNFWKITV